MNEWMMEASLKELENIAKEIAKRLTENGIIFLRGDLASGKTTLVQALAKVKGCENGVTSPTFSIQQIYDCGIFHYDLYQCSTKKFLEMGLLEALEERGWHLIEWGDATLEALLKSYGFSIVVVNIEPKGTMRRYRIEWNE